MTGVTFDLNNIVTTNRNTAALSYLTCTAPIFDHNFIINGKRLGLTIANTSYGQFTDNYFQRAFPAFPTIDITNLVNDGSGGIRATVDSITNLTEDRRVVVYGVTGTGALPNNARGLMTVSNITATTADLRSVTISTVYGMVSSTGSNGGLVRIYVNAAAYNAVTAYASAKVRLSYMASIPGDVYYSISAYATLSVAISAAANNGAGAVRLTVAATTNLPTNAGILVANTTGTADYNGYHRITQISGTEIDLIGSTYTSGMTGNLTIYRLDLAGTSWDSYVYSAGNCEYSYPSTFSGTYTAPSGQMDIANEYQNRSFLASGYTGVNSYNRISGNTMTGWGMTLSGNHYQISNNTVSQFDYGAGIALLADSLTYNCVVQGNTLTGGFGLDIDITQPSGIESWGRNTVIQGNLVHTNANAGINVGGKLSIVTGNTVYNNGSYNSTGVGIAMAWQDSTYNGSFSVIADNTLVDTGVGYQKFGYQEYTGYAFSNVTVARNKLDSMVTPYEWSTASDYCTFTGYVYSKSATVNYATALLAVGQRSFVATMTINGVALGDHVEIALADSTLYVGLWTPYAFVTSANTVAIHVINNTGGAASCTGSYLTYVQVTQRKP